MTKEVAEEVARRLSTNGMLKALYDADHSDYRERIDSRAAEAVDKRQGRDNHYGNHDQELSPDCQSEDQDDSLTSGSSLTGDCQSPETEYKETCSPTLMATVKVGNILIPTGYVEVSLLCLSNYSMGNIVGAGQ